MPTISLTGIFHPAPGKKAETGLDDPYVIFISNEGSNGASKAILFEPTAVVSMPDSFSKESPISLEVYEEAICKRKQGGIYYTDNIGSAITNRDIDGTFTYNNHPHYH